MLVLWTLLLAGGCDPNTVVTPENGQAIGFQAGIQLLDGDTRALNTNTSFSQGQKFHVYGRRTGEGRNTRIFGENGEEVELKDHDSNPSTPLKWVYENTSYWYWVSSANYYDFLAVYPHTASSSRMVNAQGKDIPGNMAIQSVYALDEDNAGTRRTGNVSDRTAPVLLEFNHLLSAVRIRVTNQSKTTNFRLDSLYFTNIVNRGAAKATIDPLGYPEFSWIDTERKAKVNPSDPTSKFVRLRVDKPNLVLYGTSKVDPDAVPAKVGTCTRDWKLMIPGDHTITSNGTEDTDYLPKLYIVFTVVGDDGSTTIGSQRTSFVYLKDIRRDPNNGDDLITEWEMGVRYTYNISLRLDGDVIISIITTEWDDIIAETPGILI